MALETLLNVEEIGGFKVISMEELREKYPEKFNESGAMDWEWFEKEIRPNYFIYIRHDKNSISFTLQNGPIEVVKKHNMFNDFEYHIASLAEHPAEMKYGSEEFSEYVWNLMENNSKEWQEWVEFLKEEGIEYSGVNGCQVDTLIHAAKMIIEGFNAKYPCNENDRAIHYLNSALMALEERTKNRQERGVEGTNNE